MNSNKETSNKILQAALEYAKMGFSVIPVGRNKKPYINWKEWQSKKADEKRIRSWFNKYEKANVGIVTGKISGIVVVDVEAGGKIDDLPSTATVRTGGGGWHYYYKFNEVNPISNYTRIREITDIRGEGGYVVAPPSIHQSGKAYSWLSGINEHPLVDFPSWLLSSPAHSPSSQCSESTEESPDKGTFYEGNRNDTATRIAGGIISKIAQVDWETVGWPHLKQWNLDKCIPPLEEKELQGVWDSIIKCEKVKKVSNHKSKGTMVQVTEIYSKRFRNGQVVEAYYDPEKEETGLISFNEGDISTFSSLNINNVTYAATPAKNKLISSGFVKLPLMVCPYQSESNLLQEIKKFIHRYVQIPEDFEDIATFYVLLTWVYDEFQELPYLRAIGDFGSGKSRFLKVLGALCYRSVFINGNVSSSALFRITDELKGTLILDEADFQNSDTSNEIVKILNSGFQKGIPVFRSEAKGDANKSYDPIPYDVFGPKVIATRKDFTDDALESRCLNNVMETLTREDIPENLDDIFEKEGLDIRNMLLSFRFQKLQQGISKHGLPKMNIEPRLRQIISPIYRVISDEGCKKLILDFIMKKQQEVINSRFNSFEGELLQSLLTLKETNPEPTMKVIAEKYNEQFGGKYPIKPKRVGTVLDQIFHLQKQKGAQGFFVCNNEGNEHQISSLKKKFGLEKPEVNEMNIVNVPEKDNTDLMNEIKTVFGVTDDAVSEMPF